MVALAFSAYPDNFSQDFDINLIRAARYSQFQILLCILAITIN